MTRKAPAHAWKKGQSGNPKGKPPGVKNRISLIREALITPTQAREVVEKLIEKALAGDVQAGGMLLERLWPRLKPTSMPVSFPLPHTGTLADQAEAVMRECADARIPVADAAAILSALATVARIHETSEFEARLKALELRTMFKRERGD